MARTIAKDHAEKRQQILQIAAKIFAEEGFKGASMNQIASDCGISKANIYHYYSSKEDLLFDLLDQYLSDLRDKVCGIADPSLSAEDRLRATIHAVLGAYKGADDHHKVQISGLSALPDARQKSLQAYQRDMVRHVSSIIREIAPDRIGEDRAKLRAVTMSVFGMLNWYYMWNSGAGQDAREAYGDTVAALTLNGLNGI